MEKHTTLAGEVLEYDPKPAEAAYLARVVDATNDPRVTESELVALVYGAENPMLKHGILPGRGLVTTETWDNPVHRVVMDYLDQKRVATGTLDPQATAERYTMTVPEAAEVTGMAQTSVRSAVHAGRLSSWRKGRAIYLDPEEVRAYRPGRQGPKGHRAAQAGGAPLAVCVGGKDGHSFLMKAPSQLVDSTKESRVRIGTLPAGWQRVAVKYNDKASDGMELFILEPADEEHQIERAGFFVRGPFQVVRHIPHGMKATRAYKEFQAE